MIPNDMHLQACNTSLTSHKEKNKGIEGWGGGGGGDKNLSFCLQAMSISAENIREW